MREPKFKFSNNPIKLEVVNSYPFDFTSINDLTVKIWLQIKIKQGILTDY